MVLFFLFLRHTSCFLSSLKFVILTYSPSSRQSFTRRIFLPYLQTSMNKTQKFVIIKMTITREARSKFVWRICWKIMSGKIRLKIKERIFYGRLFSLLKSNLEKSDLITHGRISYTAESLNNVHKYKIYYETKYRKENKETENNMSC